MRLNNRYKGNIGEDIACEYLIDKGFSIKERNYSKRWGEIDIIAVKDKILHFVEVKSTIDYGRVLTHRPEENVNYLKIRKLRRIISTYLIEKEYGTEIPFKFHVIAIIIDNTTGKSSIKMLEDIIL